MKKIDHRAEMAQEYYDALIVALRHVAHRCGYALGVHGSLRRDIDLIAAPWRDSATSAESLIQHLSKAAEAIIGTVRQREDDANPRKMPCGRLAWAIYLSHRDEDTYLDISVMPIVRTESATEKTTGQ